MTGRSPPTERRRRTGATALLAAVVLLAACTADDEVPILPRFEDAARPAEPQAYRTLGTVPPRPKDLDSPGVRAALQRQLEEEREAIRRGEPVPAWEWPTGKPASAATVGRTITGVDLSAGLPDKPAAPAGAAIAEKPDEPAPDDPDATAGPAASAEEILRRGRPEPPPRPALAPP
jgi:hypothetical protein